MFISTYWLIWQFNLNDENKLEKMFILDPTNNIFLSEELFLKISEDLQLKITCWLHLI